MDIQTPASGGGDPVGDGIDSSSLLSSSLA